MLVVTNYLFMGAVYLVRRFGMKRKWKFANRRIVATLVVLLLFSSATPLIAVDYLSIDTGTHDIDYTIGGYLMVGNPDPCQNPTVNLLPGSHIQELSGMGDLYALENSTINITGGSIDGIVEVVSTSLVIVYGSQFQLDGTPLDPATTHISNPLSQPVTHQLNGTFPDGTAFTMTIKLDFSAKISLNWPQPEPEIVVYPATGLHDFGDVPIGEPNTTYLVQIMNIGTDDLNIDSITLNSDVFEITTAPTPPFVIAPSNTFIVDIEVTFTPSAVDDFNATLLIASDDDDESLIEVYLYGVGVIEEGPPAQQIQYITDFVDASVADGTLLGYGPGNSTQKRLAALQNMINAAGDLINAEDYDQAREQLQSIQKKIDGQKSPPDFVVGDAAATLNAMVTALIEDLSS